MKQAVIQLIGKMRKVAASHDANANDKSNELTLLLAEAILLIGAKEYKDIQKSIPFCKGYSIAYREIANNNMVFDFTNFDDAGVRGALGYFSAIAHFLTKAPVVLPQKNLENELLILAKDHHEKSEFLFTEPGITLAQRLKELRSIRKDLGGDDITEVSSPDFVNGKKTGRRLALDKLNDSKAWRVHALNLHGDIGPVVPYDILLAIDLPIISKKRICTHRSLVEKSKYYLIGYLKGFDELLTSIEKEVFSSPVREDHSDTEDSLGLDDSFTVAAAPLLAEISVKRTAAAQLASMAFQDLSHGDAMEVDNALSEIAATFDKVQQVLQSGSDNSHSQQTFFSSIAVSQVSSTMFFNHSASLGGVEVVMPELKIEEPPDDEVVSAPKRRKLE